MNITLTRSCADLRGPLGLEVATVAVLLLCGCGGPTPTLDASAMPDASAVDASAPTPDAQDGPTVQVTSTVVSLGEAPLSGVSVSDALHPSVSPSVTGADGTFLLVVPAGEPVLLEARSEGRLTTLLTLPPVSTDFEFPFVFHATRDELNATLTPPIAPSEAGSAVFGLVGVVGNAPRADISFASDAPEVRDIAYDDGTSSYSAGSATVEFGKALAMTDPAPPSTIEFRATSVRGRTCAATEGWRGSSDEVFAAPARADTLTLVVFDCLPAADTRLVSGRLREYIPGIPIGSGPQLEGVSVCLHETSECTRSSALGDYSLDAPRDVDIALTYDHPGHEGILTVLRAGGDIVRSHALPVAGFVAETVTRFGATHDPSRGAIEFFTSPDVTVALTDGVGDGPHYLDPMSAPDTALTATSSRGWGWFFDLAPTDSVSLRFDHASRLCTEMGESALTSPEPETIRVPVAAGHITFANLRCP